MTKKYTGSLTLEWFNKQKAILNLNDDGIKSKDDVPAPAINWINKDEALFYEVSEKEGKGNKPYWVNRDDIRVKEARPLIFQKAYKAVENDKSDTGYTIQEISKEEDTKDIENMLIKGDNLLALNTLKKYFDELPDNEKVKCIYIDPPYNTGKAFEHYEDNLEASTWLTLMNDRIVKLRDLLKDDGVIFIQLDEKFIFHLKVMLDEIFGKANFVNLFTVKTSDPSGFKTVNPSPYDSSEYILMYAKSKSDYKYETLHVPSVHDFGYSQYIKNISDDYTSWEVVGLNQYIAEREGYEDTRKATKKMGKNIFKMLVSEFAIENSNSVFQGTAIGNDAGQDMIKLRNESKQNKGVFLNLIRSSGIIEYAYNGRQVYFYSKKIKVINNKKTSTKHLTNIWMDIPYNGISNEGNVKFAESKKPEALIHRILKIANVNEGDIVLDSFSGSGTTISVANKMNAKWIGIELGNHSDSLIIPRLNSVISNTDKGGITENANWQGGGSFKYYHLGESIISIDSETGKGEFNWNLGKKFIQESLLQSYDFIPQNDINVFPTALFQDDDNKPSIGKLLKNKKAIYGVVYLVSPNDKELSISNDDIKTILNTLRNQDDFLSLVIYTNKGVDMALDTVPEDLEIIKVPHAIFAELER